jgi:hypothetical protein
VLADHLSHGWGVRDAHDEAHRPILPLTQDVSLQLGCAQLRLEVNDPPLDLDRDHLHRQAHDQVVRAPASVPDRDLKPALPGTRRLQDALRDCKLA